MIGMLSQLLVFFFFFFFYYLLLNSVVHRSSIESIHLDNHVTELIRKMITLSKDSTGKYVQIEIKLWD